ncbi:Ribosomal protein S24E [Pyrobaculum oguniense TE7]|uniref:Small ribosomal subunit protein eS24 n=1 Tax=Pyrobaculum oguniense (strain DSM 13380 / JCM 10595 / TE7) TaxID=698757 RepID=H6Q850_PYROT|nr:Ribosomal protein S24E [Pyrobaculum oguniense TE7]
MSYWRFVYTQDYVVATREEEEGGEMNSENLFAAHNYGTSSRLASRYARLTYRRHGVKFFNYLFVRAVSAESFNISAIRENKLLARREVLVEISHQKAPTPTRKDVREWVAKQLGVDVSSVFIRKIKTEYGIGKSVAEVHVYSDGKMARIIEPLYIHARNLGEEGKKLLEEVRKKRSERREKKRKRKR